MTSSKPCFPLFTLNIVFVSSANMSAYMSHICGESSMWSIFVNYYFICIIIINVCSIDTNKIMDLDFYRFYHNIPSSLLMHNGRSYQMWPPKYMGFEQKITCRGRVSNPRPPDYEYCLLWKTC